MSAPNSFRWDTLPRVVDAATAMLFGVTDTQLPDPDFICHDGLIHWPLWREDRIKALREQMRNGD